MIVNIGMLFVASIYAYAAKERAKITKLHLDEVRKMVMHVRMQGRR